MQDSGFHIFQKKSAGETTYNDRIISKENLSDQENHKYFEEYKKLLFTAYCIQKQKQVLISHENMLQEKLASLQKDFSSLRNPQNLNHAEIASSQANKTKRMRRTNTMIERKFQCKHEKCDKIYASEGSLQQHIKLKHCGKSNSKESD